MNRFSSWKMSHAAYHVHGLSCLSRTWMVWLALAACVTLTATITTTYAADPPLDTTSMPPSTTTSPPPAPTPEGPLPQMLLPPMIVDFVVSHPTPTEWIIAGQVIDLDGPTGGLFVALHGVLEGMSTLTMADGYFIVVVHEVPYPEGYISATAFDAIGLESAEVGDWYAP